MTRFSNVEWSGPAWYSIVKDEKGFPKEWRLEHFLPLHLGDASSTDWDGKLLIKKLKKLKEEFPEIGTEWVQGNIHSHHTMGAFFSGTDNQQLADGSNENFYGSLVVSSKQGKEYAFAFTYPDQFNKHHKIDVNQIVEEINFEENEIWTKEADIIEKAKKKRKPVWTTNVVNRGTQPYAYWRNGNQHQLLLGEENKTKEKTDKKGRTIEDIFNSYDDLCIELHSQGITERQFNARCKKLGLDPSGSPIKGWDEFEKIYGDVTYYQANDHGAAPYGGWYD